MINLCSAMKSERLMKALTGLKIAQFNLLVAAFDKHLEITFKTIRGVSVNLGRDFVLKTAEEKLFYILFYVKCYPTFDLAAFIFGVDKSSCCRWSHWFMEALKLTLDKELVLPKRKINNPGKLFREFPALKEIYIDGTERPIRRPKNPKEQQENYSGKKKKHTKKNILITTGSKKILYVSPTKAGKVHDYNIFKEEALGNNIPKEIGINLDTGFQGIGKDYPWLKSIIPKKKPKGGELSSEEKESNKRKSKKRVIIENVIAGVKRLRIVTDIFRNHKKDFVDLAMLIACGIWNYYLKTS